MKVLVISHMYPNARKPLDGIFVKERLKNLCRHCEIKVVCPYPWFPALGFLKKLSMPKKEIQDNIEVYYPKYFPLPGKYFNLVKGFWSFLFIRNVVVNIQKRFNFDIIHAHRVYPDGFAAILLGKIFKKPIVITIHGSDINILIKSFIIKRMIRFSLTRAKCIITVSNALKEKIIGLGIAGNKIEILSNAIDSDKFKPINKIEARKKIDLPLTKKIILFVGNFVYAKNPLLLIDLAYEIKKQGRSDLFFIMVGDGELKQKIIDKIKYLSVKEIVKLIEQKQHDEIPLWMNAADVFVLPSRFEGLPTVLVEAMACGLPIVATKVGGIPEIIKDNERGILIEPNDATAIVKGVLTLADNENLREKFKVEGLKFIKERKLTW